MVDGLQNVRAIRNEQLPFAYKSGPATEEFLKEKIESNGPIGQVMACANFIWASFQLFLLMMHYSIPNTVDFGQIPGFSILFSIAEATKFNANDMTGGFGLLQMIIPFVIYQIMHVVLAEVLMSGINEKDDRKIDWFVMAYGPTFALEVLITFYGIATIHTELGFLFATVVFCCLKCYSLFIAKRMCNLFKALFLLQDSKYTVTGTRVIDLDDAIEFA